MHELRDVGISSAAWVSDTLVTFGRKNGELLLSGGASEQGRER